MCFMHGNVCADFLIRARIENTIYGTEYPDSLLKKIFRAQHSLKKVMLTVFLDVQVPVNPDSLEKDAGVNRASYWLILCQNSPHLLRTQSTTSLRRGRTPSQTVSGK